MPPSHPTSWPSSFVDVPTIHQAFAPMVREQRFDVSEIAIATFLQAKAYRKPLVLLPVVLAACFQQSALLCRTDGDIRRPGDLVDRRVGVRAYSQTTGVWLRGILADEHAIRPEAVRWVTFEDAHVAEYRDPPFAERAPPGSDLVAMLRHGELDAIIVGNEVPNDPSLRTVFPDLEASAEAFRSKLARSRPDLILELVRLFRQANIAAPHAADRERYQIGRSALQPAISLVLRYTAEQGLLPRRLDIDEVWEGLPVGLE